MSTAQIPSVRVKIAAPLACACARVDRPSDSTGGLGSSTVTHSTGYDSPGFAASMSKFGQARHLERLQRAAERRQIAPLARLAVRDEAVEDGVAAVLGLVEDAVEHRARVVGEPAGGHLRMRDHGPLARAVAPVEEVLRELVSGRVLELPLTAWDRLDPQALPYGDCTFDGVVSAFGAALAPRPRRTAAELVRVVRPGGVVAFASWVPKGLPGRLDELLERPEGLRPPSDWGRQGVMRERFEPLLEDLELRTRTVQLSFPDDGTLYAVLGAPPGERAVLDRLLASCNNAVDRVEIDARYLVAIGRRPC